VFHCVVSGAAIDIMTIDTNTHETILRVCRVQMMKGLFLILYLNFQANRGELKAVVAKCKGVIDLYTRSPKSPPPINDKRHQPHYPE
jgi:hypothetical protein